MTDRCELAAAGSASSRMTCTGGNANAWLRPGRKRPPRTASVPRRTHEGDSSVVNAMLRLNFIQPDIDAKQLSDRYKAGLEMARFADRVGFTAVSLEEHHGADNGWSPAPLATAAAILASTETINVMLMALLVPLHDPLRIAEDIAVIDLLSGGRLMTVGGIGYR